jgi:hypothetical protein
VSPTQLETSSLQASEHNQQRNQVVLRLLAEGSVVVALIAIGWGMWNVGSDTLSSQSDSLTAERSKLYLAGCPVPDPFEKSPARGVLARTEAVLTKARLTQ